MELYILREDESLNKNISYIKVFEPFITHKYANENHIKYKKYCANIYISVRSLDHNAQLEREMCVLSPKDITPVSKMPFHEYCKCS